MDLELTLKAVCIAGEAHKRQKRKATGLPYVNHVLRVGHAAAKAGLPPEAVAAAFLHDVVEDTEITLDDLRREFPERVVHLVELLTKWWPDDAPDSVKRDATPKYYDNILQDQDAMAIKLLDRSDNLNDMVRTLSRARRWAKHYLEKTNRDFPPIYDACTNSFARKSFKDAIQRLTKALKRTESAAGSLQLKRPERTL